MKKTVKYKIKTVLNEGGHNVIFFYNLKTHTMTYYRMTVYFNNINHIYYFIQ